MTKSNLQREICFVRANKTKYGGAEVYLSRLSAALEKENIKHKLINSVFPKFLPSWIRVILFNLQVCATKGHKFYFSLDRIICPDIYRAGDGVHKAFLKIEKKSKLNPLHTVYLFLEKRSFRKAKRIIAISEMVKKDIVDNYAVDSAKIKVIYNGINLKEINYDQSFNKLSAEFGINKGQPILLFVGSGFKRKGVDEFLQIIAQLKVSNFVAFIIGKEKNIKYYQQLSKRLKIDHQVVFTGTRKDVDDFYAISDIFLFPTHYEPFGSVILEAMNFENAVFTTRQCGGGEILKKDFIMDNPTDYSIVKKIKNLINNKDILASVKKENRIISQRFSIEKNLSETLKVINEVIN